MSAWLNIGTLATFSELPIQQTTSPYSCIMAIISRVATENWWKIINDLKFETKSCRSTHDVTENISTFARRRNSVNQRGLGSTNVKPLSNWWQVLWILRSFKTLQKVIYTVPSNTIYPWFLSKTKPKLVILHCHRNLVSRVMYHSPPPPRPRQ